MQIDILVPNYFGGEYYFENETNFALIIKENN